MAKDTEDRLVERTIEDARHKFDDARHYADGKKAEFDAVVADHPLAFVGGAFIGGLLVGKMLSDRR
jgi:hypothetical protein